MGQMTQRWCRIEGSIGRAAYLVLGRKIDEQGGKGRSEARELVVSEFKMRRYCVVLTMKVGKRFAAIPEVW